MAVWQELTHPKQSHNKDWGSGAVFPIAKAKDAMHMEAKKVDQTCPPNLMCSELQHMCRHFDVRVHN
ncbi:hypothetical protein M378DRAFT_169061, partial [Amanita muscaria Koide BX008]